MFGNIFRRRKIYKDIEPDEILIDAANLPEFDTARLEGRIERPLENKTFNAFVILLSLVLIIMTGRLAYLQIVGHDAFAVRAEENRLSQKLSIADRGRLLDRNGKPLAENNETASSTYPERAYPLGEASGTVIGYVSYPKEDKNGNLYQTDTEGVAGAEEFFNERLKGENGLIIAETDAKGDPVSGSIVRDPVPGEDIKLSLDSDLQKELYEAIGHRAEESKWQGGGGVIMDIKTGELLAVASYPSYDPEVMSSGQPKEKIASLLKDSRSPFIDRVVSGLYTPGSVVKPFMAVAALEQGVITPEKQILSTGSISVPNPFDPEHPSVFKDWRAQGWVDMRHAIAVSSDVYFYEVGGGFETQPGLGISAIEKYMRTFGFGALTGVSLYGEKEGVIPDPEWKAALFDNEPWYLGDTYHTAIGQYGFQITLMQLVRAVASLANGGTMVTPVIEAGTQGTQTKLPLSDAHLQVAREGMRLCVTEGICQAVAIPGIRVAAKTGTAEVGVHKEFTNSLIEGFFPADHPRYAFAIALEHGKAGTGQGAPSVMGQVLEWIVANKPDMAQ